MCGKHYFTVFFQHPEYLPAGFLGHQNGKDGTDRRIEVVIRQRIISMSAHVTDTAGKYLDCLGIFRHNRGRPNALPIF